MTELRNPGVQFNIGHDLDGNIGDWVNAVRTSLSRDFKLEKESLPYPTSWNVWEHWGLDKLDFYKKYSEMIANGILREIAIYPQELEFLMECSARGHQNHIITHRRLGTNNDELAVAHTYCWIGENLAAANICSITIAEDKNVFGGELYFDDNIENVKKFNDRGYGFAYLTDMPYNQDTDMDNVRVRTYDDKIATVNHLEQQIMGSDIWQMTYNKDLSEDVEEVRSRAIADGDDPDKAEARYLENI